MAADVQPTSSRVWIVWLIVLAILGLFLGWALLGWSTPRGFDDAPFVEWSPDRPAAASASRT